MIKAIFLGLTIFTLLWGIAQCTTRNSYYAPSGGRSSYTNFPGGGPGRGK
ncbi:hypothetical protein Riv7116_2862 [Rivularia sp. PCC 7116]|nr:hypothetical protein Riv7116_2862 [Rivularia sp. PCC 7116]